MMRNLAYNKPYLLSLESKILIILVHIDKY